MTAQSTPTISEKIRPYHYHACASRKAWAPHQTEYAPCDCGLLQLLADFAERITPEAPDIDPGFMLDGFNAARDLITQNVKAELGAAPINSKEDV